MAIKFTILGLLIYVAMAAYLSAFAISFLRLRKTAACVFFLGFVAAAMAFGYRWLQVGHVPMKNLFEVFLTLGMLAWPISLFCRWFLRVGGERIDMLIATVLLFPAGFVMSESVRYLPPALQSPLFVPHVGMYMLATVILARAACHAGATIIMGDRSGGEGLASNEIATWRMTCFGFPLLTAGLLLGATWGKIAWGDWWNWDPKEMWSLAAWLGYVGYFHFRAMNGRRFPRINAAWSLIAFAMIVITLLWVNLARIFKGLHSYA